METTYARCCGLDVHKKSVFACRRIIGQNGQEESIVRSFGTTTRQLLALSDWLAEAGVTDVAMESTGVFWKPIWNILNGRFTLLLANARDVKQVAGRKTDVKDCEWIAQLLQHGLLRPSFVPPQEIRELRDLTRHRAQLVAERTAVANRIHKILEDANIKLGSVASDILGVSGRDMLDALVAGQEDPEKLADMARRRLRGKIPELRLALEGHVTEHHRFMLRMLLDQLRSVEGFIAKFDQKIEQVMAPFESKVELLTTATGFGRRTVQNVIAEIGVNMSVFPTAGNLASWAGMSPGNNRCRVPCSLIDASRFS